MSESFLSRLRFPYRHQPLFSVLFFLTFFVPLFFVSTGIGDGFEVPKLFLFYFGLGLALIFFFARSPQVFRRHKWLFIFLALFLFWSVVTTIFSLDHVNSLIGIYGRFTLSLLFNTGWVLAIFFYLAVFDDDKLIFLSKALTLCSAIIAILGIAQTQGFAFYLGPNEQLRSLAPSFLGNPNFSSMFLVGVLPLILWLLIRAASKWSKLYYSIVSFFVIWAIVAFTSRGSIIAMLFELAALVLVGLVSAHRRQLAVVAALALVVSLALFVPFYNASRPGSIGQTFNLSETTVQNRLFAWDGALEIIKHHPITGTGLANFFLALRQVNLSPLANGERFDDAHNLYLQIAATGGIPLLIFFVGIMVVALWAGYSQWKITKQILPLVLSVALVALLISASFNPFVISCWLLLAFLVAALIYPQASVVTITRSVMTRTVGIVLGAALSLIALCFITGEVLAFQGRIQYLNHNYSTSLKWGMWASYLNPNNGNALNDWAASRIHLGLDPAVTAKIIDRNIALHPASSGSYQNAQTLYYLLYLQTNSATYKQKLYNVIDHELKLDPYYTGTYGTVAYISNKIGDKPQLLYYARKSLVFDDQQFYGWILLAQAYQQLNLRQQTLFALEHAYKLGPNPLLKKTLTDFRTAPDFSKTTLPVFFPEPDI